MRSSTREISHRGLRWGLGAALAATAALLGVPAFQGCSASSSMPEEVVVFVSGDSRGYLEPCGCRADQAGGLPGRATVIEDRHAQNRLVFDVGNLTAGSRPYELMKLRYLAQGMKAIGYDAVNLGRTEASLDRETLRQALRDSDLPFVSANVTDRDSGKPLVEPFRILRRGGLRVGVTGVTRIDSMEVGPGLTVRPAVEALAEVIPALKKQCDYLVVLAFVDEEAQRDIAAKYHEVDCILGGDVPQPSSGVTQVNRAILFSVVDRGKVIGEIDLKRGGDGYKPASAQGIKILRDKIKPHARMVSLIDKYKQELRDRRYELASAEGMERISTVSGTADEFVGDRTCAACHQPETAVASNSGHMRAFQTLVKAKSEFDPECLKCHTVGYGLHSGFVDQTRTPHLGNVQCESCHGRGKDHVAVMTRALREPELQKAVSLIKAPSTLKPVTQASCVNCHDEENSANFSYAAFWPKVAHASSWKDARQFWEARDSLLPKVGGKVQ